MTPSSLAIPIGRQAYSTMKLFATGALKGEGLALRWEDVNLAARTVPIRRSLKWGRSRDF